MRRGLLQAARAVIGMGPLLRISSLCATHLLEVTADLTDLTGEAAKVCIDFVFERHWRAFCVFSTYSDRRSPPPVHNVRLHYLLYYGVA